MRVALPGGVCFYGGMTRKGPVDLSGMDRRFFEGAEPGSLGRVAVPPTCAGDRTGREAGPGLDQLVAPAVVRRPFQPGIGTLDWHSVAAIDLISRTGTTSALRAQAGQAARHQGDLAGRGPESRA